MNRLVLLGLLLIHSWLAIAQTVTIRDRETGEPVPFARIVAEAHHLSATANAEGRAELSAFRSVKRLYVGSLGYRTARRSYEQIAADSFVVELEPSPLNLDEIVVSASRWPQSTADLSAKAVSISAKEAAFYNPQTAADLLGLSGQVFIQKSQQGGGSPMMRGFAANRLVYSVDGVRMNTAIFRSGNLQNVISLDPFALERAEALFGPGSVSYGSDAVGGAMSFQTLSPTFSADEETLVKGKAVTRYASANGEQTAHFDVNLGWEKWALLSSFSAWDFGHLRQGRHGPDDYLKSDYVQRQDSADVVIRQEDELLQRPTAYRQMNLMQKVRFAPHADWDVQYAFHFSETSSYGRYDRHNRRRDGAPRYAQWDYGPQAWQMHHLQVSHEGGGRLYDGATLRLAWQSFEESRITRDFNAPERLTRTEQVEAYSFNLDLAKSVGSASLFYGVELVRNEVYSDGTGENIVTASRFDASDRYPQATWQSAAVYLNGEYRLSEQAVLQAGLRYNRFRLSADFSDNAAFFPLPFETAEMDDHSLTGSLGAVYRPAEDWTFRAAFGTAFRSPNVDDIGKVFDSEPGAVVVPNDGLQAEYAYNLDLGLSKAFGDRLKIDLTGFYTLLEDALVRRDFQLEGQDSVFYDGELSQVQAVQNAASAYVYGLQAEVFVRLMKDVSFSSDLSWQEGEEEQDDGTRSPSRHAPPLFGTSRLRYEDEKLQLAFYAQYQAERGHSQLAVSERGKTELYALDDEGRAYSPAWHTWNVKAAYRLTDAITINAGVENLADKRYRPYSSGVSGAGRNFVISLSAAF